MEKEFSFYYMSTKKRLISNFISLASVQGMNFILPLITLPYLLQVVGPAKFGLISFAQALIQYFILFTDYGFNLVATREISQARDDKKKLSVIFSTVMLVRVLLLIVSLVILLFLVFFIPKFQTDSSIYLITFGMVIGNVMFPIWFFQGIEEMKVISILNVIAKSIFTIGIFAFVKDSSQFLLVPVLNTLGAIVIGFIALHLIYHRYKVRFSMPKKDDIVFQLKEGWDIFVSNMVTSLYTTSNVFILGFFASNTIVGYFSSAEKIVKAASSVISPLTQTIYPYLSQALLESKERAMSILNRVFILVTVIMGAISLFLGFGAEWLITTFVPKYENTIPLVRILAALPLILGWANVLGILTMINFDFKKELSRIYIVAGALSIILMVCLIPTFKEYGTAINSLVTEAFATLLMAWFLWKKGIRIWRKKP